jgi:hypothetical protein
MKTSDLAVEFFIAFPEGPQVIVTEVYLNVLTEFLSEQVDLF